MTKKIVTQEEFNSTKTQLLHFKEEYERLQKEIANMKVSKEWFETDDEQSIGSKGGTIAICCNYSSWEKSTGDDFDHPFYIELTKTLSDGVSLSIEEAESLRKYLDEKIQYLKEYTSI